MRRGEGVIERGRDREREIERDRRKREGVRERGMPQSELVVTQLVLRHHPHHTTPTCVSTPGEHGVVASIGILSHDRAYNKLGGRDT